MPQVRIDDIQKALFSCCGFRQRVGEPFFAIRPAMRVGGRLLWRILRTQLVQVYMSKLPGRDGFSGYLLVLFIALGFFAVLQERHLGVPSISAEETSQIIQHDSSVVLLDVRNLDEWNSSAGHLTNALLIPLQELQSRRSTLEPFRDRRIIVYCRSGTRSRKAVRMLITEGFNAVNMRGGMREWNDRGLPAVQGRQ